MPESFFVLSKENVELARDEVISIAKTYDRFSKFQTFSNLVIIQSKTPWQKIARRATFVKTAGQLLKKLSNLFLDDSYFTLLLEAKTFACRVINLTPRKFDATDLEDAMGSMISKFSQAKVSLDNPSIIIYLILTDSQGFFGFSAEFERGLHSKKTKGHPHELDWKLSRAMINLAGLKEGDTVCDPFCGTGTTLLEAESMGIHSIGIDFDKKMCEVSKRNLKDRQFDSEIYNSDYKYLDKIGDRYDGIVTDLPYGRASKTTEDPEKLLRSFVSIIPKKKRLAIMCKKGDENGLNLVPSKKYEVYRHKSLTRMILVK